MPVKFVFDIPQMTAWMLLHQTYNSIAKCEDQAFAEVDLTPQQYAVLWSIKHADGPATPTQIADWLDRNLNSMTLIIDRMEKGGLIKRVRDIKDRRSFRVAMTKKGEQHLKAGGIRGASLTEQLLRNLSDKELQTLVELLEKVRTESTRLWPKPKALKKVAVGEHPRMAKFFRGPVGAGLEPKSRKRKVSKV
jgi:DNA-binding MarR family transcriptional regulator